MKDIGGKFKLGLIWSVIGQFGYLLITFSTNIFLARLLSPEEFGVIGIATFFIVISKVLTESGLSGALVRKIDANDSDFSTIFLFNVVVSIFLYILLFLLSPKIEIYYDITNLSYYLRVLGLVLIINSFQLIQNVKLIKKLQYKKISSYSLFSISISSILAIIIAHLGYGVWALIFHQLINSLLLSLIYWIRERGLNSYVFSITSFKELYSFGLYTTLSSILNTGFDNIYHLVLGKYFGLIQTGLYYQAKKLTEIPVGVVKSTTLGVVFAALSNKQDDAEKFDEMYNNIVRLFTMVVGLICLVVFLFSKEIILTFYGEKWLDADFYMKVLAISSFFYMQEMFNRILFKVYNKTQRIFVLEILKKSINMITLLVGVYYMSIDLLMYGFLLTNIVSYFINYYESRKIYKSDNPLLEMIYAFYVIATAVVVMVLYNVVGNLIEFSSILYNLYFLPLVIISYVVLLSILNVANLKDLRLLTNLKR